MKQSLAEFFFKERCSLEEVTENLQTSPIKLQGMKKDNNSKNSRKLRIVELALDSIMQYLSSPHGLTSSFKDFSEAPVAVLREARQLPNATNTLQKRYSYKFSPLGPNPNGIHTVLDKKQTLDKP